MIKLLLVDDHKIVRDGIRSQLEDDMRFVILGEAADGQEALDKLTDSRVEVVIMDINMEPVDGITATERVTQEFPNVKVLALTMLTENQHIKQMLKAGAAGYLLKNCKAEELKNAIVSIAEGRTYYSPEVTKVIMNSFSGNSGNKQPKRTNTQIPLTEREKEVLRLILKEYSNKEIAQELFISVRTVDAHKRNLLEKTQSKNIAGLVLYAVNHQLFDDL